MALPTNDDINQLEFIYNGLPFDDSINTDTSQMEFIYNGLPFLDNIYDSISVTVFIPILMII